MKKILLALAIALPLFSFAQTNDWAVCDLIQTTAKGELKTGQIIYTVNTKNISDDILPEDLCVYLNTENEDVAIDGGTCHTAFDAGVTNSTEFLLTPSNGVDKFDAKIKLKSNTNEEDYCEIEVEISIGLILNLEEITLRENPTDVFLYDMTGRLVDGSYRGMCIKKAIYSNGYVKHEKLYIN